MNPTLSDLLTAPWKTAVVFAAVRLKLFAILSTREMTSEEIASECGAIPRLLRPILDVCVAMGLLERKSGMHANSEFGRTHLVEGAPLYVGDLIQLQHSEFKQWYDLHNLVTGRRAPETPLSSDDADWRTFIRAMNNLGMLGEADALANAVDLSGCKSMADAGGGSGLYSVMLCRKYPELRSTILDVGKTLAVTEELLATHEEKDRITLREADIETDSFGKDLDVVLLSDVIYDQAAAVPILKNAWGGLRQDGFLVVRGYYADPDQSNRLFGALFVLNVLAFDPNRNVMTISSLEANVGEIGFRIRRVEPLTERSWILVARK